MKEPVSTHLKAVEVYFDCDWIVGDCNAVLLPSFNSIGAPSYDTAQYSLIASTGQSIIYECLNSLGSRQTLAGGREVTGKLKRALPM